MGKAFHPAVVVAAYNRPGSLKRILDSLDRAVIDDQVTLIISIDNDAPNNLDVKSIAEKFRWSHGPKEVRFQ